MLVPLYSIMLLFNSSCFLLAWLQPVHQGLKSPSSSVCDKCQLGQSLHFIGCNQNGFAAWHQTLAMIRSQPCRKSILCFVTICRFLATHPLLTVMLLLHSFLIFLKLPKILQSSSRDGGVPRGWHGVAVATGKIRKSDHICKLVNIILYYAESHYLLRTSSLTFTQTPVEFQNGFAHLVDQELSQWQRWRWVQELSIVHKLLPPCLPYHNFIQPWDFNRLKLTSLQIYL